MKALNIRDGKAMSILV